MILALDICDSHPEACVAPIDVTRLQTDGVWSREKQNNPFADYYKVIHRYLTFVLCPNLFWTCSKVFLVQPKNFWTIQNSFGAPIDVTRLQTNGVWTREKQNNPFADYYKIMIWVYPIFGLSWVGHAGSKSGWIKSV